MRNAWIALAAAFFCFPSLVVDAFADGPPNIVTEFDSDLEGWTVIEDGTTSWQAAGGNPGGWMRVDDFTEGDWIWAKAPASILGGWTGWQYISVDVRIVSGSPSETVDFMISGPGGSATFTSGQVPTSGWLTFTTELEESRWSVTSGTWAALLADVTEFLVRAEYRTGDEAVGIDNVTLLSPLDPTPAWTFSGPVHLGDNNRTGCDPPAPYGPSVTLPFDLPYAPAWAALSIQSADVAGGAYLDRVLVNGAVLSRLPGSPTSQCTVYNSRFVGLVSGLLHPGGNELMIEAGGGGNLDDIWVRTISLAISATDQVPFEIVSATTDRQLYQNGVDTAVLTITMRSNWGASDSLHLVVALDPSVGQVMTAGEDVFALTPGGEHASVFSWPVPDSSYAMEFAGRIRLTDQGSIPPIVLNTEISRWFEANPLDANVVEEFQTQVDGCWTHQEECGLRLVSYVPVFGRLASIAVAADDFCSISAYAAAGDREAAAGAFWAAETKLGKQLVLEALTGLTEMIPVVGGAVTTVRILHTTGALARECWGGWTEDLLGWIPRKGGDRDQAAVVDSLMTWVTAGLDATDADVADCLVVGGSCTLRVDADGSWVDADSTGLLYASVVPIDTLAAIAMTTPGLHKFHGTPGDNPHSAAILIAESRRDQLVSVALLHTRADGVRDLLRYAGVPAGEGTRLSIFVSDDQTAPPLEVDLDGDGHVDQIYYPGGIVVGIDTNDPAHSGTGWLVPPAPNPAAREAKLQFVLHNAGPVQLQLFDPAGRLVRELVNEWMSMGPHTVQWDGTTDNGRAVAHGVYFCRLTTAAGIATTRLLVVR
jgi:hypothetical protein